MLTIIPAIGFNTYSSFPPKKCSYTNCSQPAYYESIGIQVPESLSKDIQRASTPEGEIFDSAKQLLSDGPAIERLVVFLKTKIIPEYSNYISNQIFKHHAKLILNKLKINETCLLTNSNIVDILIELDLFPKDYIEKC